MSITVVVEVLHKDLHIGISFDVLKGKDENSLKTLLENFQKPSKPCFHLTIPTEAFEYPQNAGKKTEVIILQWSPYDVELYLS